MVLCQGCSEGVYFCRLQRTFGWVLEVMAGFAVWLCMNEYLWDNNPILGISGIPHFINVTPECRSPPWKHNSNFVNESLVETQTTTVIWDSSPADAGSPWQHIVAGCRLETGWHQHVKQSYVEDLGLGIRSEGFGLSEQTYYSFWNF